MKKKFLSMVILGCLLINTTIFTVSKPKNNVNKRPIILASSSVDPVSE